MNVPRPQDCFTLIVPSDPQSLSVVRVVVEALSELAGHDEQARYEAVLAVNEACSNIINHAHGSQRERPLILEGRVSADGLEIRLRDEGSQFDLATVPDLDPTELRKGGRGVYLIRRMMDEVSCVPGPQGNELRMLKRARTSPG
jgi:anti-sigma regulatory factor (Ser/Thr protein kinase)